VYVRGVQNIADPSLVDDPAKDKQFAEPAIDAARLQKDEVWKMLSDLTALFENTYFTFFFKIKKTRFLRFLEMTSKNVENVIKVSECALWNNQQLHIHATLYNNVD